MAQNKNGPIIGLSIFVLLSVVFAVFWYMSWTDNQQIRGQMLAAENTDQNDKGTINDQIKQLNVLKELIGEGPNTDVGHLEADDDKSVSWKVKDLISRKAGDSTSVPENLEGALLKTASESDNHNYNATTRMVELKDAKRTYEDELTKKDEEIQTHKDARAAAEEKLEKREATHREQMAELEQQNDQLRNDKTALDQEYKNFKVQAEREIQDLNQDINEYRNAVVNLRQQLREKQDLAFFEPDGIISNVDHVRDLCYIDLGSEDGLQVGVTFSVYTQDHSGVGRASTDDIKGRIEVVKVLGPHTAEAAILMQKPGSPIAGDDPIFSPIFQSGQALEIAVVGRLTTDGLDRAQFHRLVKAAGSKVSVEVNDVGAFMDALGNEITENDAKAKITARTRFIVIADLGDSETKDPELEKLYKTIFDNATVLRKEAEKLGIYEVGLSTYLEHIGYSRKQVGWTPESSFPFPARLANGARSRTVNGTFGNRESLSVISGKYSGRRSPTAVSTGQTSKAYSN